MLSRPVINSYLRVFSPFLSFRTLAPVQNSPVAIFWDYENCPSPQNLGPTVVNNIREIAQRYGSVTLFKAYLKLSQSTPIKSNTCSELQSCGVSLTDCPHNGRKDVADKMILVDMMTHAMDTPAPATIILITGDRDFVYAVSILRLRRYNVVVLAPKLSHEGLRTRASEVIDWDYKVLGKAMPLSLRLRRPLKTVPQDTLTAPSVSTSSTTSPPSRLASTPPVRFSQPTPTRNSKHQSYAVDSNVSPKSGHRCAFHSQAPFAPEPLALCPASVDGLSTQDDAKCDVIPTTIPIDVSSDGISASGTPTNDPRYQTEVTQD